jgi:peptidoglycan hydrolase-like protein with peptidoglycan-binding domain/outer membrane protein assembly factor BamD (BamD/ComL family)
VVTKYLPSFSVATGIAGLIVLCLSTDIALADKRVALVVGNSTYQNVARLPNPERDATAMAKLFRDAGFNTVVAVNNVVAMDFKRAIRNFEDAAIDSDIAVVYYAGHGIEIGGVNYLIPVDAKLAGDRDAQDEAILIERLVQSVDEAKRLRVIILDACRDNPFVANMRRKPRTTTRAIYAGLGKVEPTGTTTLIAYATKAGSTAEDGDGEHSAYTTALLRNLTTPGLDIRLAFGRVRDQVMKITGGRQEPFVYGSLSGGNISLVPAPEKPIEPDIANVKADYELVAQIGTKKAWDVFLGTYMTGFYADLARTQIAKLGERGDSTPSAAPPKVIASLEPPAPPEPAKPTSDELIAWRKISGTSDKDALAKFISRYPNSPLALNAKNRLDVLERAAREREEKARTEREASQQRADEERRAKESARIAELKAENERRAKELAEAEKQKKEEAARIAAQQRAEEEQRAKEAARIAELKAENERRAKELAEAEKQKVEMACRNEQARLDDLNAAGKSTSVRDDLKRLSQNLTCERLGPQVVASLDKVTSELDKSATLPSPQANTPELVASAQKELARLGCYSGDSDGKLDAATKSAIKKYQVEREQPVTGIAVTDGFVRELRKLKLRVCPAVIVDKPKRNNNRKEARHERSNSSISEPRPQARQQASGRRERSNSSISEPRPQARQQASGGAHAPMIGIGF